MAESKWMLANLLAMIIGAGSLAFYLTAFVLPEVHRRSDFFWSGVGLFYAVVLWYCSGQMGGAVLLGQTASVGLLLWLGYQTLLLRRVTTPAAQQTPIQFGKAERGRGNGESPRPIANDYEFVEDGVKDAVDADPDPDSPILIKPAADEFAVRMVVPAAMPKPEVTSTLAEDESPWDDPVETPSAPPVKQRARPNPSAAVGIVTGWLKDLVIPKKKVPTPMIELPPRPPSIPNPGVIPATGIEAETATIPGPSSINPPDPTPELGSMEAPLGTSDVPSAVSGKEAPAIAPPPTPDDEASNWPEEEFWD